MSLRLKREPGQSTVITVPPSDKPTRIVAHTVQQNSHVQWDAPAEVEIWRGEIQAEIDVAVRLAGKAVTCGE